MGNTTRVPGAGPEEQKILDEIRRKTGLQFERLAGIDTRHRRHALAVLPLLRSRLDEIADQSVRCVVYSLFCTKHAGPWIESIISWWEREQDPDALSLLSVALARTVNEKYAARVWSLARQFPDRPNHYLLLARLARFKNLCDEVIESILSKRDRLSPGDVDDISRINDQRIKELVREKRKSEGDSFFKTKVSTPKFFLEVSPSEPDRSEELASTEVALRSLEGMIVDWFRNAGLRPPSIAGLTLKAVELEIDEWVRLELVECVDGWPTVWIRLEDVDTVEIVFMKRENVM